MLDQPWLKKPPELKENDLNILELNYQKTLDSFQKKTFGTIPPHSGSYQPKPRIYKKNNSSIMDPPLKLIREKLNLQSSTITNTTSISDLNMTPLSHAFDEINNETLQQILRFSRLEHLSNLNNFNSDLIVYTDPNQTNTNDETKEEIDLGIESISDTINSRSFYIHSNIGNMNNNNNESLLSTNNFSDISAIDGSGAMNHSGDQTFLMFSRQTPIHTPRIRNQRADSISVDAPLRRTRMRGNDTSQTQSVSLDLTR